MSLTERPDGAEQDAAGVNPELQAARERELARLQGIAAAAGGAGEPGLVGELRAGVDAAVLGALGAMQGIPPAGPHAGAGDQAPGVPVRAVVEVLAGMVPGGTPDPMYTRRWHITSAEWAELQAVDGKAAPGAMLRSGEALAQLAGKANGYAALLMVSGLNWVRVDWVWM